MRRINIMLDQSDPVGAATSIGDMRLVAVALADKAAGKARTKWATAVEFQGETYQMKRDEAKAWTADNDIAEAEIPHLVEEANAVGETIANIAAMVTTQDNAWRLASAKIEGLRKCAAKAIADAADEAGIRAALRISWPSP